MLITTHFNSITMILTIIILSILVIILGYAAYNSVKKNQKCEDIILKYERYIKSFDLTIKKSNIKLKEIDVRGAYSSDDEIGWFFEQIKDIQNTLDKNFTIK